MMDQPCTSVPPLIGFKKGPVKNYAQIYMQTPAE